MTAAEEWGAAFEFIAIVLALASAILLTLWLTGALTPSPPPPHVVVHCWTACVEAV